METLTRQRLARRQNRKESRQARNKARKPASCSTLSTPQYSNCLLVSPEGVDMNTISLHKAQWYLDRGLATEDTLRPGFSKILRLTFQPKAIVSNTFSITPKKNVCVVCGATERLSRHHVVPFCLRRYFPLKDKARQHAWCVLLCEPHHHELERRIHPLCQGDPERLRINRSYYHEPAQARSIIILYNMFRQATRDVLLAKHAAIIQKHMVKAGFTSFDQIPKYHKELVPYLSPKNPAKADSKTWALAHIDKLGGIEATKALFRQTLLDMQPQHLMAGFLQDHP